ncbi:MAG TPA: S8 family peptidase [Puia sp.]|nr:S8 family peptidase [Puia sp.]
MRPFLFIFLFLFQRVFAQEYKYLVHLKDKNNNGFSIANPASFLSDKSIQRRVNQNIRIDSTDLPVTAVYIDSLSSLPALRILNKSRWFNQLLIGLSDTNVLQRVLQFSFVVSSEPVNNRQIKKIPGSISANQRTAILGISGFSTNTCNLSVTDSINYGESQSQVYIHNGEYLHDLGFHGEGMTVAILDDGFNSYLSNPAFDSLRNDNRILGTYDFVNQKVSVNEEDQHGANCFSIIAANIPGTMVGTAPDASYWLFKTEDITSETPVEEQNWVAAAEFADSAGADLITTSLGYSYFDDSIYNLNYAQRNGHTALISRAANLAVAKGMIVTASAGNSGGMTNEEKYVLCPADGDSVYAVGSVDFSGVIAYSSSWGPNSSGQIKPDGVSVGAGAYYVAPDGNVNSGSGTSYSNPNLAGLITCLWQAFPEFGPHDILAAVRQSSNKYSGPDDRYGYGLPDFEKAYSTLLNKRLAAYNQLLGNDWIRVYPVPFLQSFNLVFKPSVTGNVNLELLDVSGKIIMKKTVQSTTGQLQLLEFNIVQPLSSGVYFLRYSDQKESKTLKLLKY